MPETRSALPAFIHLHLITRSVIVGERVKKATFRPCVETLPTSTLMGCFLEYFGLKETVAIGLFEAGTYRKEIFTYAPFDASLATPKLPLTVEYLAPALGRQEIEADVYVAATSEAETVFSSKGSPWPIKLGAMKSKGFGDCFLEYVEKVRPTRQTGYLRGHLRETDAPSFGVDLPQDLIRPRFGYLFRPDSYRLGGRYERAFFAETILTGPDFLIGDEYAYDR
ncbi:MAG TPA: hypothetical protein VGL91_04600 [Acidobacteriota bacterium]|jgi:hypothetical protein